MLMTEGIHRCSSEPSLIAGALWISVSRSPFIFGWHVFEQEAGSRQAPADRLAHFIDGKDTLFCIDSL